jgi:hypothetical protein
MMKRKTDNSLWLLAPPSFLLHPGSRDAENVDFTDGARRLKTFRDQNCIVFVGALFYALVSTQVVCKACMSKASCGWADTAEMHTRRYVSVSSQSIKFFSYLGVFIFASADQKHFGAANLGRNWPIKWRRRSGCSGA